MKKIISAIIIIAMVISCVSMVTFATEEKNIIGVTLTAGTDMAKNYSSSGMITATGTFTEADFVDGKLKTTVRVVNNNDFTVSIVVSFYEKSANFWEYKSVSLAAGASSTVELTNALNFTKNGDSYTASYINGANNYTINLENMLLRIQSPNDVTKGTAVTFVANDTRGVERLRTLKKGGSATWTVSDYAALGSAEAPAVTLGGASVITTTRNHRCSSPSQNITENVLKEGIGNYYVSGYVRLLEKPDKSVTAGLGVQVIGDTTGWPQTTKITVNDTEWHQITGTLTIDKTNITDVKTFAETLYSGMTGDAGAYKGDMEWDAFVVSRIYDDGTYSENLFTNPDMNIDASGNTVGWGKNQGFTMKNSLLPVQDKNALHVENRSSHTSGPSQVLTGRLEKGTYLYSAYVRLVDTPASATAMSLGIELKNAGEAVGWPATGSVTLSDNAWHKISGTVDISEDFDTAVTFINEAKALNMEMDGVFLAKQNADGTYSENIILNPTMEFDENGTTTDWGKYRVATLTNTGFTAQEPEEPEDTSFSGVENPDGTITYANGYVPVTDKNIIYSGRWYDYGESSKQVAFEGYTEIKFTGTSIKVIPGTGSAYAEIDGVLGHTLYSMGTCTITGLSAGEHTLKLFSQAQTSRFSIGGFILDKNAKTMPINEPKKIEFIGDSISEGYVNSADKLPDLAGNSYLNSFTFKTGRKLNAEYGWSFNTIAFGGIGMVRTGSPDPLAMPERYFTSREYISSTDGTTRESALSAAGTYDKKYVPDYIVINLGTNDSAPDNNVFVDAYVDFIASLKEVNPNVTIFCMSPFNGTKALQVRLAAEKYGADEGVIFVDSAKWGIPGGADNLHPAPASLDIAAEKLFEVIEKYVEKGELPETEPFINGMQFNVTSDIYHAYPYFRAGATNATGLTADMADENGYITRSYTVYNVGNCDLPIKIYWQTGWDDLKDDSACATSTVKKGTMQTFTIKVKIDENGMATHKNGSKVALSTLTFRTQIDIGTTSEITIPAGASYVVVPNDSDDFAALNVSSAALQKATDGTGNVSYNLISKLPEEKIEGANLDIGSSLTLNYMASLWENTDAIVRITHNDKTADLQGVYDAETGYYKFAYENINPQCMTDNIKAELIVDGVVVSSKDEYSVKAYADSLAKKTAVELNITEAKYNALISLLSDMLVYGREAQIYKSYNLTEYATDGITWLNASEFTVPTDGIKNIVSGNTDANNRVEASGVYVGNVNKIYFRVNITDGVTVLVDGKEATVDALNKVYTDDIFATGFSDVHTIELVKDGETISKVEYNLNAYVQIKCETPTIGSIIKAISNYGTSAKAYASEN